MLIWYALFKSTLHLRHAFLHLPISAGFEDETCMLNWLYRAKINEAVANRGLSLLSDRPHPHGKQLCYGMADEKDMPLPC